MGAPAFDRNRPDYMDDLTVRIPKGDAENFSARLGQEIGVDFDRLLHDYRQQIDRVHALAKGAARFDARFGRSSQYGTHYDNERGALLAELKEEARVLYARNPEIVTDSKGKEKTVPLTDGRASDLAHAHPRYQRFLQESEQERLAFADLTADLEQARALLRYYEKELDTRRSQAYAYGAEARLTPS